jgi:TM2 domain-containing membrane protein YozV
MVNPIVAAILSLIIPGLGQIIARETKRGLIFLVVLVILCALYLGMNMNIILSVLIIVLSIYSAYDAYQIAKAAA